MRLKRIGMLFLALALVFSVCSVAAAADYPVPPGGCSITVEAVCGGKVVPGMSYKLYKVADVDEYGAVTPTAKAAALPVHIPAQISQDEAWVTAFNSLASLADRLDQAGSGSTNAQGGLVFSGVSSGIYLILGESITVDGKVYTAAPAWAQVPVPEKDPVHWGYDVTVKPKFDVRDADDPPPIETIKVVVKWNDKTVPLSDGSDWDLSPYRPDEVTVELRKDGVVVNTVKITGPKTGTTWPTYTFPPLTEPGKYTVTEIVPGGYKVTYDVDGNVTTITNTPKPVDLDPPIKKSVKGTNPPATARFTFRMDAVEGPVEPIPMPKQVPGYPKTDPSTGKLYVEKTVTGPGEYEFGRFPLFAKGTYVYRISEVNTGESGWTYSDNSYTKTVVVDYDANGDLHVVSETLKDQNGNEIPIDPVKGERVSVFENSYTATPGPGPSPSPNPISVSLDASKVLKGSPKTTADFELRLVGKSGAPMPSGTTGSQKTVKIHGQGSASFGAMTYTAPGTYIYEVSEVNAKLLGYTYDTTVYTVTVDVTQKTDGTLAVDVSAVNNHKQSVKWDELVFTNTYKEPAPQTGILWWPVPVLLASGLLLTFAGLLRRKHES